MCVCLCLCVCVGGNTGVGRETALQLALRGSTVIIGCRSATRGASAVAHIQHALLHADTTVHPHAAVGSIECTPLDLSCFYSIKTFADSLIHTYTHVDILVCNGGLNLKGTNSNGLQELFMVNYLSHHLLFQLLEPLLTASPCNSSAVSAVRYPSEARVVNLSSVMHHEGNSEFEKSAFTRYSTGDPYSYYSDSKLYLNYLTMEINRRHGACAPTKGFQCRKVTAVSVNPGAVRSDIWRHVPWPVSVPYDLFMRAYFLNVQQGACPSLFAATTSLPHSVTSPSTPVTSSPVSLLPYVTPYRVYCNILAFEMMGPFGGAQWATPSLPTDALEKARNLYQFSNNLINTLVEREDDSGKNETRKLLKFRLEMD